MALLSQALHLGYLLSPHSAFQGHAAHTARWPAMLSPNGSSDTCISDGVFHIPMPCFHGAIPVYPKVLLHFSIMLHGAAQARGTRPINTACVERLNLTIRQHVAAVGRRVSTLCKGEDGVRDQLTLYSVYDHFCLPHAAWRQAPPPA